MNGDVGQADLEAAVLAHPGDAGAWRDLARLHASARRAYDTAECWSRVLALQPRDARALAGLARARRDEGQITRSARIFAVSSTE